MGVDEGVVQLETLGLDEQPPSLGHGVAGVGREVHENLLDLPRVHHGPERFPGEGGGQGDVFPDDPLEELLHPSHQLVQVCRGGLDVPLAAEGEQAAGQVGGALRGGRDLHHLVAHRVRVVEVQLEEFAVAADDGEDVVEIVGDSAGQKPHRLQFLGVAQLFLQPVALGQVEGDGQEPPLSVHHDVFAVILAFQGAAVLGVQGQLHPRDVPLLPERLQYPAAVLPGDPPDPDGGLSQHFLPRPPCQLQQLLVHVDEGAVLGGGDGHDERRVLERLGKFLLAEPKGLLGLLALGDLLFQQLRLRLERLLRQLALGNLVLQPAGLQVQRLLGPLVFDDQVPFAQGPLDDARQGVEDLRHFHHVVERPRFQGFDCHLLVAVRSHHDDGPDPGGAGDQIPPLAVGEQIVRQHDVVALAADAFHRLAQAACHGELVLVRKVAEPAADQLRMRIVVFHHQYSLHIRCHCRLPRLHRIRPAQTHPGRCRRGQTTSASPGDTDLELRTDPQGRSGYAWQTKRTKPASEPVSHPCRTGCT